MQKMNNNESCRFCYHCHVEAGKESNKKNPFPIYGTVKIGVFKSAAQALNELENNKIDVSRWAKELIERVEFSQVEEEIDLVKVTVADLGFPQGASVKEIFERAEKLGLELCPAEVGPTQRLKDAKQAMDDWYLIAMKPIADSDGDLGVFDVDRDSDGRCLDAYSGRPDDGYYADDSWVFRRRK